MAAAATSIPGCGHRSAEGAGRHGEPVKHIDTNRFAPRDGRRVQVQHLAVARLGAVSMRCAAGRERRRRVAQTMSSASTDMPGRSIPAPMGAPGRPVPGGAGANVWTAARTLAPVANPSSTRIAAMPSRSRGGRFPGWTRSRRRSSAHPRSATSRRSCGPIFHTLSFHDDRADAGDRPNARLGTALLVPTGQSHPVDKAATNFVGLPIGAFGSTHH